MPENFFTTEYLLSSAPPENLNLLYAIAGFFTLLIVLGIITVYSKKLHAGLKSRLFNLFLTSGIVGLVILFFEWQSIPYVGTRIVLLVFGLAMLTWYFVIVFYLLTKMRKEVEQIKNDERYSKYLPKKKSRK